MHVTDMFVYLCVQITFEMRAMKFEICSEIY